jgi:hypothetical protein
MSIISASKKVRNSALFLSLLAVGVAWPQATETATAVQKHVEYLASEKLEGRMTGTEGERLAADYLIAELKAIGAEPLPGRDSFLVPFEFTSGVSAATIGNEMVLTTTDERGISSERNFSPKTGFLPLSFSESGEIEGEVVFAGYGLKPRNSEEVGYDSYAGLDVKDKIVLVLRYSPSDADSDLKSKLERASALRVKALVARQQGAKGIIIFGGPRSEHAGELINLGFEVGGAGSGIIGLSTTGDLADALFKTVGKNVEEVQREFDTGNPHVGGFGFPNAKLKIKANLEKTKVQANNVVGMLRATSHDESTSDIIAIGAHYDHLGHGTGGGSLARRSEVGEIHYGADDNASGTAATLEAAKLLAEMNRDRKRDVLVCFWSGEELGLLGSSDFVKSKPMGDRPISAYVNLDMVGKMKDDTLTVQGTASSPEWNGILEKINVPLGLNLVLEEDPYQPTDSQEFYSAGTPVLQLFTGLHMDYHRPTDTPDKINYEGVQETAKFSAGLIAELASLESSLTYGKYQRKLPPGGGRASTRVYTGTLPDYGREVKGMALSGVAEGGPAEKAGMKAGDVIVQFGTTTVTNIYDYMYALESAKIGVETDVVVERDGARISLKLTPSERP